LALDEFFRVAKIFTSQTLFDDLALIAKRLVNDNLAHFWGNPFSLTRPIIGKVPAWQVDFVSGLFDGLARIE